MRNCVCIAMVLLALWTMLTGIVELTPIAIGAPAHHVFAAILFTLSFCAHAWLNRKAFLAYFKKLRWQWALVLLVLLLSVATTIGHP